MTRRFKVGPESITILMTLNAFRGLAALCLLALAPCARAVVHQFTFTQGGYEFGAHVEGTIYLRDDNNDGFVSSGPGAMSGETIGGYMRLIGHPIYSGLAVGFYGGRFNLQTLDFMVYGDNPYTPDEPTRLLDGFMTPTRGGFSNIRDYGPIYSNEPIVLQRVPDGGATFAMLGAALLLLFVGGRRFLGRMSVA